MGVVEVLYCNTLLLHRITGEMLKNILLGLSHRSDLRLLHPLVSLFVPDIMHSKLCDAVPVHRVSGMQWLVVV